MISVVMPYYERAKVLQETLLSYDKYYGDDVEVIVVDDGSSREPAKSLAKCRAKIITLPMKKVGYSPVIPINIGVEYATHDLIVLTLPEVRHESPVLYAMRDAHTENSYVMARCWCESLQRDLASPDARSVNGRQPHRPDGVAFNFCTMLSRDLWIRIGGMSREYRWGSHFDDTDFAHKVLASGAELKWVDDVTIHTRKEGAKAPWVAGGLARNQAIFNKAWMQ